MDQINSVPVAPILPVNQHNNSSNNKSSIINDFTSLLRRINNSDLTTLAESYRTDVQTLVSKGINLQLPFVETSSTLNTTALTNGVAGSSVLSSKKAGCRLCKVNEFAEGVQEQRQHFKSRWHLINLALADKGKPSVSKEQAAEYVSEEEEDEESDDEIVASASSSSDEEQEQRLASIQLDTHEVMVLAPSKGDLARGPMFITKLQGDICIQMSACVVRDEDELKDILRAVPAGPSTQQVWGVLLYRSGHFAAAMFHDGKMKEHKTEHRYTQRKKQGGSQAAHDGKGSKAKSAGAQLRRYGEQTMRERVAKVLQEWDWSKCERVFLAVPERARKLFVLGSKTKPEKDEHRFAKDDTRIRRIPFMTGRPTQMECERVFKLLQTVEFYPFSLTQMIVTEANKPDDRMTPVVREDEAEIQKRKEREQLERYREMGYDDLLIHEAAVKDDVEMLERALDEGNDIDARAVDGDTALHLACHHASLNVLKKLLESGADPAMKDLLRRVPYQRAKDADVRLILRDFRSAVGEEDYDWKATLIPEPPKEKTDEELAKKREREREKKKRQAERKRVEKQGAEQRQREKKLEEEAIALAILKANACPICSKPLPAKKKDRFSQGDIEFCSAACLRTHTRKLAADAAERRLLKG